MEKKYIIISPVRNEEEFIEKTIESVVNQNITPAEYIIVNDGSTDGTEELINKYVDRYDWIKTIKRPVKEHSPGAGVVDAFYAGMNILAEKDWSYIVKLDGDLKFSNDYFEELLKKFEMNSRLGMASGKTYQYNKKGKLVIDIMPDDHVRGPAKMYKRECWDEIEGMQMVLGWDTIDELKAQVLGWETFSFRELVLIHYKPIGYKQKNIVKREIKAGERQHYLGYLPLFAILRGLYRMSQRPYIIAGILNIYGYINAEIRRTEQLKDITIIKHLRNKQKQRLLLKRKLLN